jgi:hypothetical protein
MDLKEYLRRQLIFIENSCASFDRGCVDESIRMAVCLRVLFHDTKNQKSLLTQMGARQSRVLSTVPPLSPGAVIFSGMYRLILPVPGSLRVSVPLGEALHREFVLPDQWWDQVIYVGGSPIRGGVPGPQLRIRRKDVVLCAANRDGGAHVDPRLTAEYRALVEGLWRATKGPPHTEISVPDDQFVLLRQMGYEVLNSPDLLALTKQQAPPASSSAPSRGVARSLAVRTEKGGRKKVAEKGVRSGKRCQVLFPVAQDGILPLFPFLTWNEKVPDTFS